MPIFQYTAMDASGKEQKGQHEAASEEAVASFLKEQGHIPPTSFALKFASFHGLVRLSRTLSPQT